MTSILKNILLQLSDLNEANKKLESQVMSQGEAVCRLESRFNSEVGHISMIEKNSDFHEISAYKFNPDKTDK